MHRAGRLRDGSWWLNLGLHRLSQHQRLQGWRLYCRCCWARSGASLLHADVLSLLGLQLALRGQVWAACRGPAAQLCSCWLICRRDVLCCIGLSCRRRCCRRLSC